MDTGAWWAAVHGAAKSRTRVSDCHFHFLGWLVQSCALNSLSILHDSDMIASDTGLPLHAGLMQCDLSD